MARFSARSGRWKCQGLFREDHRSGINLKDGLAAIVVGSGNMMSGVRRFVIGIACAECCACAVYDSYLLGASKDGETSAAGGGGMGNASGYAGSGGGASGGPGVHPRGPTCA